MPGTTSEASGTPLLPHQFITKIVHDADTGWGFVPLIGSGLSRPSGIITGFEFTNYLAFTTYLVLCDPATRKRTHGEGVAARWNLVQQGWPPQPNQQELSDARSWILQEFKGLCQRMRVEPNYDDSDKRRIKSLAVQTPVSPSQGLVSVLMHPIIPAILASEEQIPTDDRMRRLSMLLLKSHGMPQPATFAIEGLMSDFSRSHGQHIQDMGIRALHDWRETLQFLACTEVLRDPDRLSFNSTANQSVIDAFNATITRDRHPNLAHKMLAHLAGGLRIHTILTTNFDTLTEDAFQQLSVRLRVLPVSSHGSLPNARTVAAEDTLVKLHGEAHDTRADLSLDDEPGAADLETFADYLTRGGPFSTIDKTVESRRLLVIGYSGSDYRCVQMIKRWLESAADRPIIYWVCYSQSDVIRVQHLFRSEHYRGRLRITQTTRPDLLLYELYQRLHLSLPPGGLSYEFSHILPPNRNPVYESPEQSVSAVLECVRETKDLLEACRLIIGHQGRPEDVRALARDAMVSSLSSRLVKIMGATGQSLRALTQDWQAITAAREAVCVLWQPWYRRIFDDSKVKMKEGNEVKETPSPSFVSPVIIDAVGGVVRACAIATETVSREQGVRVFWMEIVDYIDIDGMIRDFFRSLAHRFGVFQSQHVSLHPLSMPLLEFVRPSTAEVNWKSGVEAIARHLKAILEAYRVDACQLRLLIYGRDGYGSSAGLLSSAWKDTNLIRGLHCFIESLAEAGVQVIYMPLLPWRAEIRRNRESVQGGSRGSATQPPLHDEILANNRERELSKVRKGALSKSDGAVFREISASSSVYLDSLKKVLHPFMRLSVGKDGKLVVVARKTAGRDNAEKFVVFLYALCLFRHSRHPNALCSEATYQCPFRHNSRAVDNDFVRAEETSVWVAQLRSAGLFLDKPGGASWMFGDLKNGMLAAIEELDSIRFLYETPGRSDVNMRPKRGHDRAVEMRARLHFWIGDWYLKAFCSSGHHVPILEAVHHQLMACKYAPDAKPKSRPGKAVSTSSANETNDEFRKLAIYRHLLFLSALREASKTLRLAGTSLKLWQSSPFDVSWMNSEHRAKLEEDLQKASQSLSVGDEAGRIPKPVPTKSEELRTTAIREFIDCLTEIFLQFRSVLSVHPG
ncbi:MAG: SIR2 family protein, partial [Planctomycetaceae bacterium]